MALISSKEAAQRLGVTPLTLRRWILCGSGPAVIRTPGGTLRFDEGDLDSWISEHREGGAVQTKDAD